MIFRNYKDWWSNSKALGLGSSDHNREWAKEIWEELLPTIEASRDDYKNAFVKLMEEQTTRRSEFVDAALAYIEEHKQPGQVPFFKWWMERETKND